MKNIKTIARKIGLNKEVELYGNYMGKINFTDISSNKEGNLVLVTATSPTPKLVAKDTLLIWSGTKRRL